MEYSKRLKNRNIKRKLEKLLKIIHFKGLNIDFHGKIILFGLISGIISLFLPWMSDNKSDISWNSFSGVSGNIGFVSTILILIGVFILLSSSNKAKIKLYSDMRFNAYSVFIFIGVFFILSGVNVVSFIGGLQTFSESISHSGGISLYIASGLIILFGAIKMRAEVINNGVQTIINGSKDSQDINQSKNNMKLPF